MSEIETQFNWDHFHRDTRELSLAAKGAWWDCLYKMRLSVTRGRISMPISGYARMFGSTVDQAKVVIDEISEFGVGDAETEQNGKITLTNRRMFREHQKNSLSDNSNKNGELQDRQKIDPTRHISFLNLKSKKDFKKEEKNIFVEQVFGFWKRERNHPKAILTLERQRLIAARLNEGYSVDDLQNAIIGCGRSDYHMGKNDSGAIYDDLTLICRTGSKVEQFIGYLKNTKPTPVGKQSVEFVPEPPCRFCGSDTCFQLHRDEIEAEMAA